MKSANIITLILLAHGALSAASAASWVRLPHTGEAVVNQSSGDFPGVSIHSSSGVGQASALLSTGMTDAASLNTGKSQVTVKLKSQQVVDSVSFLNVRAEGTVTVLGSADLQSWSTLGQGNFTASDRYVPVQFASSQLRYIRLSFDVSNAGSIGTLKTTGAVRATGRVVENAKPDQKSVKVNVAGPAMGARIIYAYPTPSNVGDKDFQKGVLKFPNSPDGSRTIIYDLGTVRTLSEFSTAYAARPTRVEFFAYRDLPEKKDWRGKLALDPAIFDEAPPTAVGVDSRGAGRIKVTPSKPATGQYLVIRLKPLDAAALNDGVNSATEMAQSMGFENGQFTAPGDGDSGVLGVSADGSVDFQSLIDALNALLGEMGLAQGEMSADGTQATFSAAELTTLANLLNSSIFGMYLSRSVGSGAGGAGLPGDIVFTTGAGQAFIIRSGGGGQTIVIINDSL